MALRSLLHRFMSGDQGDFDSKNELTVPLKVVREAALNLLLCKRLHKQQFIKDDPADFRLFITHPNHGVGKFTVKQMSDEEIRDVYENGVDLFFNFESYI